MTSEFAKLPNCSDRNYLGIFGLKKILFPFFGGIVMEYLILLRV